MQEDLWADGAEEAAAEEKAVPAAESAASAEATGRWADVAEEAEDSLSFACPPTSWVRL